MACAVKNPGDADDEDTDTGVEGGTVVSHWWRGCKSWWVAGEWAPYQLKLDRDALMVYISTDDDDNTIRAAAPASPRRLVIRPGGGDWVVGHLRVRRELKEGKEGEEPVERIQICCTEEEPVEGEETRCANCGKRSAKNRACRGCVISHFCNSACQKEGWEGSQGEAVQVESV